MLIVDIHSLLAVHPQDLLDQVVVHGVSAADAQHLVGIQRTVGQLVAGLDHVAVLHQQAGVRHRVGAGVPVRCGDDDVHQAALAGLFELDRAADLCQSSHPLGLTGLKQFLDTGKTLGDVAAGQTAGVEGTHGQLGAGFADGLGGNDADRLARTHRLLGGQVHAVALGAHAAVGLAGQHGADHDGGVLVNRRVEGAAVAVAVVGLDPLVGLQDLGVVLVHHLGAGQQHLAGIGVHHIAHQETAPEPVGELLDHLAVLADLGDLDAVGHVAVLLPDDDILGDVHHAAGQVTGVCGTQSRVGQALPGASGGDEVLQGGQALAVVRLDGDLDGAAGGVGDQATHTSQLADLLHRTAGAGVRHHENGVIAVQVLLQGVRDIIGGLLPHLHHLLVALVLGHEAHLVLVLNVQHLLLGGRHQLVLLGGHGHICDGDRDGRQGGVLVAGGLDGVQHLSGHGEAVLVDGAVYDLAQLLLAAGEGHLIVADVGGIGPVHKAQVLRDVLVEDDTAWGGLYHSGVADAVHGHGAAHADGAVGPNHMVVVGHEGLFLAGVEVERAVGGLLLPLLQGVVGGHKVIRVHDGVSGEVGVAGILAPDGLGALLRLAHAVHGQVVGAQHHVLGGHGDGAAVLGTQQVVGGEHQDAGLRLGLGGQGHMDGHLVAVEVRVEGGAVQGVQLQGPAVHQHRLEGLDAQAVQRRSAVQHDGVVLDDDIQSVPHLGDALVHHLLGGLDVVGSAVLHQLFHDEGTEQLHGHLLGHAALVDFQLGADHDNASTGVVHALAQQVLAEPALLAL